MRGGEGIVDEDVAELGQRAWRRPDRSSPRPCGSAGSPAPRSRPAAAPATASAAGSPMQSGAKATGLPSSSPSLSATGFRLNCGSGPPFGRPKCEMTITLAPRSARSCRPGTSRSSRVASRDLAVLDRHVEVGAHQHALALHIEAGGGLELVEIHQRLLELPCRLRDLGRRDAEVLVELGRGRRGAEALHADEDAARRRASAPSPSRRPPRRRCAARRPAPPAR